MFEIGIYLFIYKEKGDVMSQEFDRLVEIVRRLRAPDGCPWDRAQTPLSIRHCLVEETGEFLDALENGDQEEMAEELGDLLLQVVLQAQMAGEQGSFDIRQVVEGECAKLIRRHPHVFGEQAASSPEEALSRWEASKAKEAAKQRRVSALDGIPRSVPALSRAAKVATRLAKRKCPPPAAAKLLQAATSRLQDVSHQLADGEMLDKRKLGDSLLLLAFFAQSQSWEAEELLQEALARFFREFSDQEKAALERGQTAEEMTAEEKAEIWRSWEEP
jgi:tetrapyrrole methylase family protein/MazG family protein